MIAGLITYIGFITFVMVYGIHYYEDKLKHFKKPSNAEHYTHLQLQNISLRQQMQQLDADNALLTRLNKELKSQLAGDSKEIQYESNTYKDNTWDINETQVDFE